MGQISVNLTKIQWANLAEMAQILIKNLETQESKVAIKK